MKDIFLLVGAVASDPRVIPLWESFREHFREHGVVLDFALFSTYERQVDALLRGHVDIAWNSALSHVRVKRSTDGRSLISPTKGMYFMPCVRQKSLTASEKIVPMSTSQPHSTAICASARHSGSVYATTSRNVVLPHAFM